MEVTNQNTILGLPQYLYYGQNERVDELNDRMATRHFPDSPLQPNFDPRSVPTKYAHFPIINRRKPMNEPVVPYLDYNQSVNFNPGSQRAPPSGYMNNVEIENQLRNQYFALQHGADQGTYIPSSDSDLYRVSVPMGSLQEEQPFPNMFVKGQFTTNVSPLFNGGSDIGKDQLYNHTRTQLRNFHT
jgi:hypothetical protein